MHHDRTYAIVQVGLEPFCNQSDYSAGSGRCGMKICPAWSAVRKTSNITISMVHISVVIGSRDK